MVPPMPLTEEDRNGSDERDGRTSRWRWPAGLLFLPTTKPDQEAWAGDLPVMVCWACVEKVEGGIPCLYLPGGWKHAVNSLTLRRQASHLPHRPESPNIPFNSRIPFRIIPLDSIFLIPFRFGFHSKIIPGYSL